ncbi:adenylosuccinate lyase [Capsulimonas corticalis]|uniref:Adenylosuccinate lyase n=1 Tax=Capsulimonas corticalis TaxID=2219043 RepID=A0A402CTA7_9BACT|nr:adenylosuccinate lyase [Capsulimonas corticalis]BDI30804.1 adenylosuccinate lyase [Capsulimonas corticalis]
MIERYSHPQMRGLWEPQAKTQRWLDVEIAVCEGLAHFGYIPQEDVEKIKADSKFELDRIAELEKETRHDVMAFVKNVQEHLGDEGRFVHFGITSYDVVDTALSLLLRDSLDLILEGVDGLMKVVGRLAVEHKDTLQIGRTHGIHAEPITFGYKLAVWYSELQRNVVRLQAARENIAYGKISGAVGTHANISPEVETWVCESLGLKAADVSTQILQRDRHAQVVTTIAILAGSLEKFATELRNLQRTEILEVQEFFAVGQRGSSAMPHKRNPWNSETVSGLARVIRGFVVPALENVTTWHERDLANSSVERVILPDTCVLMDWMLRKFTNILDTLNVYPENMKKNLEKMGGLVASEQVMLALIEKGLSRDDAYKVAQRNAAKAWEGEDFATAVAADPLVTANLTPEEVAKAFDIRYHLKHVDETFQKLGLLPQENTGGDQWRG